MANNLRLRQRRRGKSIAVAANTDYQESFPSDVYRDVHLKLSGILTASGAGTNAGDTGFGFLGKVEVMRGGTPIISMQAPDLRHLTAFLHRAYPEILPASISNGAAFLAQAKLPLDALVPDGAIDARGEEVRLQGRFRGLTNLGTTVTGFTSGKLRFGGETDKRPGGNHNEPFWFQKTIDTSAASTELSTSYQVRNDVELVPALMIRTFDASAELSDPNNFRSDGMIREIRIDVERDGKTEEIKRLSWGEAKADSTFLAGISAASGQIQTGVVIIPLDDVEGLPQLNGVPVLKKGESLIVRIDTSSTIEDEFTALTPGAGDLAVVTFLNYVPKGPGVEAVRQAAARR